jgi:cardiolipin synthase A/B
MRRCLMVAALLLAGCATEPLVVLGPNTSADPLQQQLTLDAGLNSGKRTDGNKVTVLRNGQEALSEMFRALAAAQDTIDLEYYIFEDVHSGDLGLGDLLVRKLGEGVAVNIIRDGYGSLPADPAFLKRLHDAGANMLVYHPLDAAGALELKNPNDRDHRKIMVIDGRVAFVGGVNLDRVYENPRSAGATPGSETKDAYWRDTAARIDGPAVAELQHLFMGTWTHENGPPLPERTYFPKLENAGNQVVRIIGSAPGQDRPLYYVSLVTAIHAAQHSITATTGFFVPTHQEREELAQAGRRGVAIRLVLPSVSDSADALAAGRAAYGDLLESGVQIYEIQGAVLHSKLAVVDGAWTVIGSSNFDRRSVAFNIEVDAVVLGHETAAAVESVVNADMTEAKQITLQAWEQRSFTERRHEFTAMLLEWLL